MGKIGIYGGSFNPPHKGHLLAAQEAVRTLGLDKVLFVPAAQPPHKQLADGSPDGATRLELLQRALRDLPWAEACGIELERSGPSYTADTLEQLARQYPNDRLYLLMGTDMFLSLHTWYHPERICALATIVLCIRDAADDEKREILLHQKKFLEQNLHADVEIPDTRYIDLSSTMVRRMLVFDCADEDLPDGVLDLIRAKGLYGTGRSLKQLPFEELKAASLALHKPKRVAHVCGCCETAVALARRWGEDEIVAARAGILHDVTKALDREEQLRLCGKYGMITDAFEQTNYKMLHARTGAAVARYVFGECDAVYEAIYWHTTGKAAMSTMEKILYLADYTEPNRYFEGVDALRALTYEDLDTAMLMALDMVIDELERERKAVGPYSLQARDWFRSERKVSNEAIWKQPEGTARQVPVGEQS
jgi:nicotinate-nucleotide adenylyltransferase